MKTSFQKGGKELLKKYEVDISNFESIKFLKSGGFGSVYLVQNKVTKFKCAAKVIQSNGKSDDFLALIKREISIMMRLQHQTIIKFYGYSIKDFNNENNFVIFMSFASRGSLADQIAKARKMKADHDYNNTAIQKIIIGAARGLLYLHENHLFHRDFKPDNILLDEHLHPQISDFGLSKPFDSTTSISQSQKCGTMIYMAPEIISGSKYGPKADVYAFGIFLYEILTNKIPYPEYQSGKMAEFIFTNKVVNENYRPKFTVKIKNH